ncbi:tyrosine-type recombinase/integrase [Mesorhizobium sp. M1348]|uniref:tyrosine-type recombinase/integrase n=1 Tax=Mesorhizobium sp. M1348 TaxID=2957089 RepID=UPI003338399B
MLCADEIVPFLEAVPSLEAPSALTTAYATGLRLSDVVGLNVADIDGQRGVIQIRHGKGGRVLPHASEELLRILRAHRQLAGARDGCFQSRPQRPDRRLTSTRSGWCTLRQSFAPHCWRKVSTSAFLVLLSHTHLPVHQGLTALPAHDKPARPAER